jgi:fumarate hydratase class II
LNEFRKETDSLGTVSVSAEKLWGAQTQRSLDDSFPSAIYIAAALNVTRRLPYVATTA